MMEHQILAMNWYDLFNLCEALIWWSVAGSLMVGVPGQVGWRRVSLLLGAAGFVVFGLTDFYEIGRYGAFPLWLWIPKIGSGGVILTARLIWLGKDRVRWNSREIVFAAACLLAVLLAIVLQVWLSKP